MWTIAVGRVEDLEFNPGSPQPVGAVAEQQVVAAQGVDQDANPHAAFGPLDQGVDEVPAIES